MSILITVNMYSGVQNPSWELSNDEAEELKKLLSSEHSMSTSSSPSSSGILGYRGFEVTALDEPNIPNKSLLFDGIIDFGENDQSNFVDQNSVVEKFLLSTGKNVLDNEEFAHIDEEIVKNSDGGIANSMKDFQIMAVPPYNPSKWNNNPTVKRNNNCYNYANDKITNTFAQPGRGSGQVGPFPPSCSGTGSAAERDGQIPVSSASSTPSEGQFIALVIWPGRDYHWYRLDSNAMWSHKPGQTAAKNTDNSGQLITDPKECNRGPYSSWCGYYHCIPSQTRIR